jgi:hypothetical protein
LFESCCFESLILFAGEGKEDANRFAPPGKTVLLRLRLRDANVDSKAKLQEYDYKKEAQREQRNNRGHSGLQDK